MSINVFDMKDRHYLREKKKYQFPIASREAILDYMHRVDEPISLKRLAKGLEIENSRDRGALKLRLRAMVRDGQLVSDRRNVYAIAEKSELIFGRVSAHSKGYGFLVCDNYRDDIFLSAKQMRAVLHDDRVSVRLRGYDRRGREEGEVVEVLERNITKIVGRIYYENRIPCFESLHQRIARNFVVEEYDDQLVEGQIVLGKVGQQLDYHSIPAINILEILGERLSPGMEAEVAMINHNIPRFFSADCLSEADALPVEVNEVDRLNRADLRGLDLVTIDGEDARDFDDAVYCKKLGSTGYRLIVAVADVSHYVHANSSLDIEACQRGTSVYFPRHVVPMLPEKLSTGLCSLQPNAERLAMACDMKISNDGEINSYQFYEALICSKERLTYNEVGKWIESGNFVRHQESLGALAELTKILNAKRQERGALDFETISVAFNFDETGRIKAIKPTTRNLAHRLIEECMLCANICAANLLEKSKVPGLFRVHARPENEKIEELRYFLKAFGIDLGSGASDEYQVATRALRNIKNGHILQIALLRSLPQAVYQPNNIGHFGLSLSYYTHFTSPIRRYPDLFVHRLIKSLVCSESVSDLNKDNGFGYTLEDVLQIGGHCSSAERRADEAVKEVLGWIKCDYISEKVGEDFEGVISAVTEFGFFVELAQIHIEGLVHVSTLSADYYSLDRNKQCLTGKSPGSSFGLGDSVTVQIASVDLNEKKIDLELLTHTPLTRKLAYPDNNKASGRPKLNRTTRGRSNH